MFYLPKKLFYLVANSQNIFIRQRESGWKPEGFRQERGAHRKVFIRELVGELAVDRMPVFSAINIFSAKIFFKLVPFVHWGISSLREWKIFISLMSFKFSA